MAENPFLLPPGSTPAAKPEPTIVPQVTPPVRDPDRYIALPPSIESATHRIARPDTAPTAVPVDLQSATSPSADPPVEPPVELVAEETRLAVASSEPAETAVSVPVSVFVLVLPGGDRLVVDGPLVLGRDPAPPASAPTARVVPVDDPGKTVSKTHALFEPGAHGIRVTELHSTNGVAIGSADIRTVLAPGGEGIAPPGAVIELGSLTVRVDVQ